MKAPQRQPDRPDTSVPRPFRPWQIDDLDRFQGAHCLVTGGAGFIGSNLTKELLSMGASVTVLDDFSTGKRDNLPTTPRLTVVEADISVSSDLDRLMGSCDFVFHLAAQVGNRRSIERTDADARVNVLGSVRLLQACRGAAVQKVVVASSSAIFGEARTLPISEGHGQAPSSFYGLSKLTAERYALLAQSLWGIPTVCLRFFNVYGSPLGDGEYAGVIALFLRRLLDGEALVIFGDGKQMRDFVAVTDVVQAVLLSAVRARGGSVYNIGSGQATSVLELAETLREMAGRTASLRFDEPRVGEVRRSVAAIGKARAELGYKPQKGLTEGLRELWKRSREGWTGSPQNH